MCGICWYADAIAVQHTGDDFYEVYPLVLDHAEFGEVVGRADVAAALACGVEVYHHRTGEPVTEVEAL